MGPVVGVLAYQGDVAEHCRAVESAGGAPVPVRYQQDLAGVEGLVIPGGESTTLGKLLTRFGLFDAILERAAAGMPIFGTCAGMILLAKEIEGSDQPRFGLMDVSVARNAYGPQVESFETVLDAPELGSEPLPAVFIRAPRIRRVWGEARVLASFAGAPVLVQQGRFLAASFHPELTGDLRVHRYFLELCSETPSEATA